MPTRGQVVATTVDAVPVRGTAPHSAAQRPTPTQVEPLRTISEVAQMLNVHPRTVSRAIARGELPSVRLSSRIVRISIAAVREYVHQSSIPR